MAIRRRTVHPDTVLYTETYGEVPFVSEQRLNEAVLAATEALSLAGGVLTVIVKRAPTDLEHEMVTSRAVIEWKDRTDARPQREPAEPVVQAQVVEEPQSQDPHGDGWEAAHIDDEHLELARAEVARTTVEDEEEDLSSIPAEVR